MENTQRQIARHDTRLIVDCFTYDWALNCFMISRKLHREQIRYLVSIVIKAPSGHLVVHQFSNLKSKPGAGPKWCPVALKIKCINRKRLSMKHNCWSEDQWEHLTPNCRYQVRADSRPACYCHKLTYHTPCDCWRNGSSLLSSSRVHRWLSASLVFHHSWDPCSIYMKDFVVRHTKASTHPHNHTLRQDEPWSM